MKKIIALIPIVLLVLVAACSNDKVTPQDRFDQYVKHWNEQEFNEMYNMSTTTSTEKYAKEDYVERYKNIYEDLNIDNLNITYDKLSEEKMETAMEKGTAQFPFTVEMETIAGPITFDYKATLIVEGEEENANWFVKWDPGFIFPAIKDGGEIGLSNIKPERGEILDRNQLPLALNDTVHNVGIVPGKLGSNPEKAKQKISDLLGMSIESINKNLDAGWVEPDLFVPLKKVPKSAEQTLNQLWEVSGVTERKVTGRVYPYGESLGHLVGFTGPVTAEELEEMDSGAYSANDIIGKRGLELLYEDKLRGEAGVEITVSKENEEDTILAEKPVKNGEDVVTTIDADLQMKIYESYDGKAGTAAAIHPKTGETLALVSSPSFNSNEMGFGISQSRRDELQNNPKQPLLNRFTSTYAPGSTFKPVTAAIGLNNESIIPGEGIEINGLTWSNGEGWGNYQVRRVSESNGPVDVTNALVRSDNIYFAKKAVEMGSEKYVNGLQQFGFAKDFPFEYPIETSTISSNGKLNDEVLLADTSYGQGEIQMSALHLAMAYTPFLNKGNLLKPTILADAEKSQVWQEKLITGEQATLIQEALRNVVAAPNGTAKGAHIDDLAISGKTGTAELKKSGEESGPENGWFVGYPTKNQDILISMMIENTEKQGGSAFTVGKVTELLKAVK
ncbi:penicillin-binding protein [Virgibacillus subterraneus]|uniref:serine-type D-Ala-D-Ala carboxypeptidase n=1 Tax=Virgibacillus subterraneus TaxID=621109 RepID=A0A1H9BMF2_9BACI|nr:penicillin-binding transpeptidase domain-containing protein [Virgibacillus subterraneus]SEP90132.1 penicillin-binding protein [Virgibacillus subterraneus]